MSFDYRVPGIVNVIRQPNSLLCWATAYTIMRSWQLQRSSRIREAVASVHPRYGTMFDRNQAMPPAEFSRFLRSANMRHEPMWNIPITEWARLLRTHGLLWVGTLGVVGTGTYLHSRLVERIEGDGTSGGTRFHIVDPEDGSRYPETFDVFLHHYEGAFIHSQPSTPSLKREYFQIRHF